MELSKKTTILLSPELHSHLDKIAKERGVSVGKLIRDACVAQYGSVSAEDHLKAVEALGRLSLPVADPQAMKHESHSSPKVPVGRLPKLTIQQRVRLLDEFFEAIDRDPAPEAPPLSDEALSRESLYDDHRNRL